MKNLKIFKYIIFQYNITYFPYLFTKYKHK